MAFDDPHLPASCCSNKMKQIAKVEFQFDISRWKLLSKWGKRHRFSYTSIKNKNLLDKYVV